MKSNHLFILKIILGLFLLLIGAMHFLDWKMAISTQQLSNIVSDKGEIVHIPFGNGHVRFATNFKLQDSCKELILYIHGAPGGMESFVPYFEDLELKTKFCQIIYDRPGYSGSFTTGAVTALKDQAAILEAFLFTINYDNLYLVSHSYGGPIAVELQKKTNLKIVKNLLFSPVIDPFHEKIFIVSYLTNWNWINWIFPKSYKVASKEKFSHANELKRLFKTNPFSNVFTILIHSEDDWIAPGIENISFIRKKVDKRLYKEYISKDKGHIFMFTEFDYCKSIILENCKISN
jgi:hypothetical protein